MEKKTDRVVLGVVGCFAAFVIAAVAAVVLVIVWVRSRPARSVSSDSEDPALPAPRPGQPFPARPCVAPPGPAGELVEPLRVHDPSRIDLAELYDQARSLVLRLEPNARLVLISALKEAKDGTFDSAEGNFSFNFEYRCLRAGAPPGQDLYQGMLLVYAQGGTVRASRVLAGEAPMLAFFGGLPEPPCSTVAAWTTAVATGVPADARPTFLYSRAVGSGRGASWLITVAGHPFKREIDGRTCRLRPNSTFHPDLTDPGVALPDLHPTALPVTSAAPVAPPAEPHPVPGPFSALEWDRPIEAADMTAVDVGELFSQARVVAEKLQPGAQCTGLTAFETTHGKADLTGEARIVYKFEIAGLDPAQPPGKDAIERAIEVTAQHRMLHGVRRDWPATQLTHFGGPVEPPVCTSGQAWEVATKSGVPDTAVATLQYYDHTPFTAGGPWVWSVRVEGHDDYRREIDGKTCAMVKSWGPSPSPTASAGPSEAPAAPRPGASSGGACVLNVNSIPISQALLDGRPLGYTPRVSVPVSCGSHTVTFIHREFGRKSIPLTVAPGKPATAAVKF